MGTALRSLSNRSMRSSSESMGILLQGSCWEFDANDPPSSMILQQLFLMGLKKEMLYCLFRQEKHLPGRVMQQAIPRPLRAAHQKSNKGERCDRSIEQSQPLFHLPLQEMK